MTKHPQKILFITYEFIMVLLALASIFLIIMDYANVIQINQFPYSFIDNGILIIFTIDYFTRLLLAQNKWQFFKHNMYDLLSIIPVSGMFTFFRITRISRLIRLLRIIRLIGLADRMKSFLKTNGLIYYLYGSGTVLLITSCIYSISEKVSIKTALWWSITTASTVGYGDIPPNTNLGKMAAVMLMFLGIGFVGLLTSSITSFFTDTNNDNLNNSINELQKENRELAAKLDAIEQLLKSNKS